MKVYITMKGALIDKVYFWKASAMSRVSRLRKAYKQHAPTYYYYEEQKVIDRP